MREEELCDVDGTSCVVTKRRIDPESKGRKRGEGVRLEEYDLRGHESETAEREDRRWT